MSAVTQPADATGPISSTVPTASTSGVTPLPKKVTINASTTLEELSAGAVVTEESVVFPGAQAPDRSRMVDADGLGIAVHEWGSPDSRPLVLLHGGLDFARTFDVFAPLIAAGGWRVVSWDHRSHGDSEWAPFGNWNADVRDAFYVVQSIDGPHAGRPMPIIGHSKGGHMAVRLGEVMPHRFSKMINIDGMPSKRSAPDITDTERTRMLTTEVGGWLDLRRRADGQRKAGLLTDLAKRRAVMNPRLTPQWLAYLVSTGARRDADGWRWKLDPALRPGGFGPWRPEWSLQSLATVDMPFLGLLCAHSEPMGWLTRPDDVRAYLPSHARVEVADTGHFIHIERPGLVAEMVLEFLS